MAIPKVILAGTLALFAVIGVAGHSEEKSLLFPLKQPLKQQGRYFMLH